MTESAVQGISADFALSTIDVIAKASEQVTWRRDRFRGGRRWNYAGFTQGNPGAFVDVNVRRCESAPIVATAEQPRFLNVRGHKFLAILGWRNHNQMFAAIKLLTWIQLDLVETFTKAAIDVKIQNANALDAGIGFQNNFEDCCRVEIGSENPSFGIKQLAEGLLDVADNRIKGGAGGGFDKRFHANLFVFRTFDIHFGGDEATGLQAGTDRSDEITRKKRRRATGIRHDDDGDRTGHRDAREIRMSVSDCRGVCDAARFLGKRDEVFRSDRAVAAFQAAGSHSLQVVKGLLVPAADGGTLIGDFVDAGNNGKHPGDAAGAGIVGASAAAVAKGIRNNERARFGNPSVVTIAKKNGTFRSVQREPGVLWAGAKKIVDSPPRFRLIVLLGDDGK